MTNRTLDDNTNHTKQIVEKYKFHSIIPLIQTYFENSSIVSLKTVK